MSIGQPHILSVTEVQRGIQFISASLTGDADNWQDIVTQNGLRPPYVTLDASEIYGPPLATATLSNETSIDTQSLVIPNEPQSINTLYISASGSNGLIAETVGVQSYDGTTFTLATPLQNIYPQGASVQMFAVQGTATVLLPGDVLYLPSTSSNVNFAMGSQGLLTDAFGSDIAFPISFSNGDISTVQGINTANQRFSSVLITDQNSVPLHLDFGSKLRANIGTSPTQTKWTALARSALVSLPEVSDVKNMQTTVDGSTLYINADVYPESSQTAIQLQNLPVPLSSS